MLSHGHKPDLFGNIKSSFKKGPPPANAPGKPGGSEAKTDTAEAPKTDAGGGAEKPPAKRTPPKAANTPKPSSRRNRRGKSSPGKQPGE